MQRREFITLLGVAAWPLAARAQQRPKVWRVGCLFASSTSDIVVSYFEAFKTKLGELGYVEGQNLIVDVRRAEGNFSRLAALAADLVALRPDVILAVATPGVAAAQRATSSIPIVMGPTADPIGSGFVKSLAKPGGNITGVSMMSADLSAKSLEFFTEIVPNAKRIAALRSGNPVHEVLINEINTAAHRLGLTITPVMAATPSDLDAAFASMAKEGYDGVVVLADARITARIPELAAEARLPAIYQFPGFAKFGGLLGYGPNLPELFRRAAVQVDRIFKGANPAELPVEQPTQFDLAINLKTAKTLGLTVPPSLLVRADEVIE
jgi:putative tryptophan/tyrosine transport system substrate-binding protein